MRLWIILAVLYVSGCAGRPPGNPNWIPGTKPNTYQYNWDGALLGVASQNPDGTWLADGCNHKNDMASLVEGGTVRHGLLRVSSGG